MDFTSSSPRNVPVMSRVHRILGLETIPQSSFRGILEELILSCFTMVYTRDLGGLSEVANKAKGVHILFAVSHFIVCHEPPTLKNSPVALPQHATGLDFRLRDVNIEPGWRKTDL